MVEKLVAKTEKPFPLKSSVNKYNQIAMINIRRQFFLRCKEKKLLGYYLRGVILIEIFQTRLDASPISTY